MVHAFVGRALVAAGMLALAGCARENGAHPAYLGLSDLAAGSAAADPMPETPEALRHIQSNKVLGAMAFQKITGQAIDPESLVGHTGE